MYLPSEQPETVVSQQLQVTIRKLVSKTLDKFKTLSNPKQWEKFDTICREKFSFSVGTRTEPEPSTSHASGTETTTAKPVPISPVKTRQTLKCASCKILKGSLKAMRLKRLEMQREKDVTIRNLIAKQKKKDAVKVLNQKIKRKESQISKLKNKIDTSVQEMSQTKKALSTWEKKHNRLKRYHKAKKTLPSDALCLDANAERICDLEAEIEMKDEQIVQLQND